ncbi:hypothetical protein C8Q77DRAFT_1045369 [Trametes polyzona]|nr:hypothetical protein C8Q77DRAFT_1045369 [Trametes polyzona]
MAPTRTAEKDTSAEGETVKQRRKPGRAPVSCAECRRLKLRCDRKVPCETCTKRGCAALCPDGSLPTTKGPKKAAADAEQLKKRVQELEAALRTLQETVSDEPHPLLNGGEASSSQVLDTPPSSNTESPPQTEEEHDEDDGILDAFGTLTLGSRGEARFFGQTSRSEYLIHAPERLASYAPPKLPNLTHLTIDEANMELDVPCTNHAVGEEILRCLPSITRALHLCDLFFSKSKYLWYPVPREYVINEIIPTIYHPSESVVSMCHVAKKHGIALLCMIFSLATLFDLDMPPYAAEAHEFYLIARVSLRWAPPAFDTTLASIQALIYMSTYLEMSDCEPAHTGSHKAWMLIRQAAALGQSVNVNSTKWQLDHNAATKRGRIFWQLATYDAWLSFGYGRPPCMSLAFVDCEVPSEDDAVVNEQDRSDGIYHAWCWRFTKVLYDVMTATSGAKPPTYAKVFELDRRIRDFAVPASLRIPCTPQTQPEPTDVVMQRLFVTLEKENTLLNLHRPYFSIAVRDAPQDPLRHKFGPSVMSIYRSAWRMLTTSQSAYRADPGTTGRCGMVWSHTLACAILLCLLITRAPKSTLAGPCLMELDRICSLFEEAAVKSQVASNNIEVIRKLSKQAQSAMTSVRAEDAAAVALELDRLGGKTQLIQTIGERIVHCHPLARPAPPGPPSMLEVSAIAPGIRANVASASTADGAGQPFDLSANTYGYHTQPTRQQQLAEAPFQFPDFTPDDALFADLGLASATISSGGGADPLAGFEAAGGGDGPAGWDAAAMSEWFQGNAADFIQPNVADAEATWQALVQQLGI